MEERSFHPLDYTSVLRRRKWWFIAPLGLSIVVGALLAMVWPREYTSAAEIGIADPTLSPELLKGVQSFDAQERQRAISQQLLSRAVLERVVREENMRPGKPAEETAAQLRGKVEKNIVVPQPIGRVGAPREGIESFLLGYVDSNPETAQRIANRLATVFVEENSKTKTQQAQNTSEVLANQLKASQERLAKLQEQLRVKKQANIGRLPDQMNANVSMVNGLRSQYESLSLQFRTEQDRLSMIEGQLEAIKQGPGGAMTTTGQAAIMGAQTRINDLERQLRQYQANGYTDQHPDIIATKEELAVARRELNSVRQQTPGANNAELTAADPAYRQKINERDAAKLRVNTLQRQMSQALAQIGSYQSRVDSAPLVEQELSSLVQEESLERKRYEDLSAQYQRAQVAEDVTRNQGGERFVVLNPARLPTRPTSPDLLRMMVMAIGLGFMLGVAAVIGREFLDRSVHDARVLQSEFEVPVLGEIPRIRV